MKICAVSPGVVHAVDRTIAIASQFNEMHFIDLTGVADTHRLESHGIIYHGPRRTGSSPINSLQLQRLFERIEPDAIVCHFASGDHFFSAVSYGRCPVVAIAMGHDVLYDMGDCFVPLFRRLLTRMALRQCLFISAKARGLVERMKDYGVRCPIDVNYWGANFKQYFPGQKNAARRKLGWEHSGPIVLSSRAIEPRLNIHLAVEAFHEVLLSYPNALLVIIGRSKPDYRKTIEHLIDKLNIVDRVCVLGEISQDVLSQCTQASDVVISLARSDGFPNTLLEVMACKVPIVVGRIENVEELLEDNTNAWICEIEPHAIAAAIVEVLRDSKKSERISNAAFETVKTYGEISKNGIEFSTNLKRRIAQGNRHSRIKTNIFRMLYLLYRINRKLIPN